MTVCAGAPQEGLVAQLQARLRDSEMALAAEKLASAVGPPAVPPGTGRALSPYGSLLSRNPSPFCRTLSPVPVRMHSSPSPTHSNSSWDGEGLGAMRWELACLHGDQAALGQLTLQELQG
jgi:hypothetical protein